MPTYEYECKKCGHVFEAIQSITADALKRCPKAECPEGTGRGTVQRLIGGGGGLLFKGSGFYITDYRSDSYKAAAKADGGSSKSSESSSGDSGTSKDTKSKGTTSKGKEKTSSSSSSSSSD
jgi:putative FmdB family regulatory protein